MRLRIIEPFRRDARRQRRDPVDYRVLDQAPCSKKLSRNQRPRRLDATVLPSSPSMNGMNSSA
ncbi:hypothetical protein C5689_14380 [Methylosinus sporium]|uniref:Uncharacterized protein n=1 Tax=Methylosinus sporium TaxID=428 RepID=A0A2U1SNJ8_METSR|nr:hypothetical protein C5689_14380 [Methylosinus sporium]